MPHAVHSDSPVVAAYLPTGQLRQELSPAPCATGPKVPVGQSVQEEELATLYVPALHGTHALMEVALGVLFEVPAGHGEHGSFPDPSALNVPTPHGAAIAIDAERMLRRNNDTMDFTFCTNPLSSLYASSQALRSLILYILDLLLPSITGFRNNEALFPNYPDTLAPCL